MTSGLHHFAPYMPLPVLQHADSATTLRQAGVGVEQAIADAMARDAEEEGDATAAPAAGQTTGRAGRRVGVISVYTQIL